MGRRRAAALPQLRSAQLGRRRHLRHRRRQADVPQGTYKLPAPQTEQENCVAHNGSIIPVPGRDIMVQAWYQGGISVFDFTEAAQPVEIAYFDRGPIDAKRQSTGGYWSAYYYRGRIYGTEIARGLDVFALKPSAHLSANEIAAAALANQGGRVQPAAAISGRWPAEPVVARAYMDQLRRGGAARRRRSTSASARRWRRRKCRSTPAPRPPRRRSNCARSPAK